MATETLNLSLQPRTITGKKVKTLRRQGILPVGVFGSGFEPYSAQVDEREFMRIINKAGFTTLIELSMPGQKKQQAFLQELQRHPVSLRVLHADLKIVDVNKAVEVDVPVVTVGENELVDRNQAILNHVLYNVTVRALPTNIPHQVEVDVSTLTDFDHPVHVSDLNLPADVELITSGEEVVVTLAHPRVEAAPVEAEAEAEGEIAVETPEEAE